MSYDRGRHVLWGALCLGGVLSWGRYDRLPDIPPHTNMHKNKLNL